jgi:anti-sigma regulatory factor (Ser/Thr protein kinase)
MSLTTLSGSGFRHEALLYAGQDEFLAGTVPFISSAIAAADPILVAVPDDQVRALKSELDADSDAVQFANMEELGRNPARIIPAWRDFVESSRGTGRPLWGIGEPIWSGRSAAELVECHHHEFLLNLAFANTADFWLLCPYDTAALDPEVVEKARCSHPLVAEEAVSRESDAYLEPALAPGPFEGALPPPSGEPEELGFERPALHEVRSFVADRATRARLGVDRVADLVLAVSELASNSMLHAGGRGTVRIWQEPSAMVCEVMDVGRFEEPLLGRVRPAPNKSTGRGLWLVNQLCDLVQMRSLANGNVVRLHMRRPQ